jgi:hypothetical protein
VDQHADAGSRRAARSTAEDAQVQEKVRLALWRMDSLTSALLIRENSRPAWHYQAFYAPDDLFASSTQSIPKGQALMPIAFVWQPAGACAAPL